MKTFLNVGGGKMTVVGHIQSCLTETSPDKWIVLSLVENPFNINEYYGKLVVRLETSKGASAIIEVYRNKNVKKPDRVKLSFRRKVAATPFKEELNYTGVYDEVLKTFQKRLAK